MKKQAVSNHVLELVSKELEEQIIDKRVDKVQQVGPEVFKFSFSPGSRKLIIEPGKRMHLTDYDYKAPLKASNAAMFLRKKLKGKRLISIEKKPNDRVVIFTFDDYFLIVEFFSHGNFVLTDKNYVILFTFRKEQWKDRELRKKAVYKFPSNQAKPKEEFFPISKEDYEKQGSANKALDDYYSRKTAVSENPALEKLRRRLEMQEEKIKEYDAKALEERAKADWIYKNYELVEKAINLFKQSKKQELEGLGAKIVNGKIVFDA